MKRIIQGLLWLAALFFLTEAFLHAFGIKLLEHDKIYLITHDGYIALFALTYAMLLILISTDLEKYRILFFLTMAGIFLALLNAAWIAYSGGYASFFPVIRLDGDLQIIGLFFWVWFILTTFLFLKEDKFFAKKKKERI